MSESDQSRPVKEATLTTDDGREIKVSLVNNDQSLSVDAVRADGEKTGVGVELSALFD